MPAEYRRRASLGLNLTPLIDIVLLLLVFFMLTAHFVEERALDVDLPQAQAGAAGQDVPQAEIVIGADGRLQVNDRPVAPEELEATLRRILHAPGPKSVRLRADRQSQLEPAVQAMDAARRAGARSLDIVTRRP